jgi:hypothetical protein
MGIYGIVWEYFQFGISMANIYFHNIPIVSFSFMLNHHGISGEYHFSVMGYHGNITLHNMI